MPRRKKGIVYLIHFETKLAHAQHYIGYTDDLDKRIARHRSGRGAKLLAALNLKRIRWWINRVWFKVDKSFERALKNRKNASKLCPHCNLQAMQITCRKDKR